MAEQQAFIASLPDLGVIAVTGADAADFLHNQLTNDVTGLAANAACLAGYCSPKGRLLATLLVWKSADSIFLLLPRSLVAATQKRLQMFVLRAKVKLEDRGDQIAISGIALPADTSASAIPVLPGAAFWQTALAGGTLIRVPDGAGLRRALWIGPAADTAALHAALPADIATAPASLWHWTDIQAGLPQVLEATREQFVPQMVNFELVGGVNFRKGCYPGQEIVARSQYLGKLKRRMLLATANAADATNVLAGTEVFSDADPRQPCGMVVNAERGPDGQLALLIETKMDAIDSVIRIGSPSGEPLQLGKLPYALDAALDADT